EEERLNRIKHSNKFPTRAIRSCLEVAGAKLGEIDRIAFYATEAYCDSMLANIYLRRPEMRERLHARTAIRGLLADQLGAVVDLEKIIFVPHHVAHAASAFDMSGFDEALVLAIDGYGDSVSGLTARGKDGELEILETFPQRDSLGLFYLEVIAFI